MIFLKAIVFNTKCWYNVSKNKWQLAISGLTLLLIKFFAVKYFY
jgi:hypothetical protein